MENMATKYGAGRFDDDDANDRLAEKCRKAVIDAYASAIGPEDDDAPRQGEFIVAGLMVGVVQIIQASLSVSGDTADAATRASLLQITPWAVDMARAFEGRDPLPDTQ